MRIAVVNQHPGQALGGSEVQCDLIARGLIDRGHEVTYVAVRPTGDRSVLEDDDYPIVQAERDPRAILEAVAGVDPDVVYWRFNRRGLREVARGLRAAGVPLVVALAHEDDVNAWPTWPWPPPDAGLRDRLADARERYRWRRQRSAFRDVTAIASQREDLLGRAPVARQRLLPNVMDPTTEPFAWPRPFVAWVGNVRARKRPELIPPIADVLAPHGIDLLVVGPLADPRYATVVQGPARSNVRHLGPRTPHQVTGVLAAARCLAVTARPEGFSNVMIQAWWSGTPTVTFDYDPDGLVVEEGLGACAGGDLNRFLAEIEWFALDGQARDTAGARARGFARARFALDPILDDLVGFLEQVVEETTR